MMMSGRVATAAFQIARLFSNFSSLVTTFTALSLAVALRFETGSDTILVSTGTNMVDVKGLVSQEV